ncbi:MAG: DUF4389 domain-containing protein [Dehalococcoidales bacterium]|nr:DUF4389 domain-containing protein [Dehalococcoidales bacterium]
MAEQMTPYAATLSIDYPDRKLNRLTSFFRIFTSIPIWIVLVLLIAGAAYESNEAREAGWRFQTTTAAGIVTLPTMLMILFQQKYPKWWFDWNLAFSRFSMRVSAYVMLMRDEYPSTDEEQAVHLDLVYPDVKKDLNRWLPLVKWFLAIPHYIILVFLGVAAGVSVIIVWFAILFTGRYPKELFDFILGVFRWSLRVEAYSTLMLTDKYPPFALN